MTCIRQLTRYLHLSGSRKGRPWPSEFERLGREVDRYGLARSRQQWPTFGGRGVIQVPGRASTSAARGYAAPPCWEGYGRPRTSARRLCYQGNSTRRTGAQRGNTGGQQFRSTSLPFQSCFKPCLRVISGCFRAVLPIVNVLFGSVTETLARGTGPCGEIAQARRLRLCPSSALPMLLALFRQLFICAPSSLRCRPAPRKPRRINVFTLGQLPTTRLPRLRP